MGRQQLLLVILVTIIVGIITLVAVKNFGTAGQANRDAVRQELMDAATQAQSVWARPALMDGANRDFIDYVNDNSPGKLLELLNIPSNTFDGSSATLNNENGTYLLAVQDTDELTITATPVSGGDNIVMTLSRENDTESWVVEIDGSPIVEEE